MKELAKVLLISVMAIVGWEGTGWALRYYERHLSTRDMWGWSMERNGAAWESAPMGSICRSPRRWVLTMAGEFDGLAWQVWQCVNDGRIRPPPAHIR